MSTETARIGPEAVFAEPAADQLLMELLMTPEGRADPHSRYRALREMAPRYKPDFGPVWFLTRYEDSRTILRDSRFGKADPDPDAPPNPLFGSPRRRRDDSRMAKSLLDLNPPDHTRLRALVSRGFTPRRVEALRPAVGAMCDDILDEMAAAAEVDVLDALAFPLPVRVIGELIGVPRDDRDQFRALVRTAASTLEPGTTDDDIDAAIVAMDQMTEYFAAHIELRRREPADDLTSVLIAAQDDADRLTEEEMIITLILIFSAGFETTTNLIGNGLATLLTHPEEMARLRADHSLLPSALEEIVRYESPVQLDARTALDDADLDGIAMPAGTTVVTLLGAANRDPEVFDEPERFHITKRDAPVMSFASGIHYCLGASLARLEGQEVFGRLLERFDTIELLDDEPAWRNSIVLRGLDHLNVRVS